MKMNEIIDTINMLAHSQGFYGRLLNSIMNMKENFPIDYEMLTEELEAQNFKDAVDMALYFEC